MDEEREDRASLMAMKRQGPIVRVTAWISVATAVSALLSQTIPPVWNALVGNEISQLKTELAISRTNEKQLLSQVEELKAKLEEGEKDRNDLKWSVKMIGAEVRLRHGDNVQYVPIENPPETRKGRLVRVIQENEKLFEPEPKPKSLSEQVTP